MGRDGGGRLKKKKKGSERVGRTKWILCGGGESYGGADRGMKNLSTEESRGQVRPERAIGRRGGSTIRGGFTEGRVWGRMFMKGKRGRKKEQK